jgi:hypothetical protein
VPAKKIVELGFARPMVHGQAFQRAQW